MKCFYPFKDKSKHKKQPQKEKKKKKESKLVHKEGRSSCSTINSPKSIPELYAEKAHFLRVFTYSELRKATNGFNKLLKIGEGGFGSVYKAAISPPDGEGDRVIVAVKKLKKDGLQGHKQWVAEVQFLGVVEHPNLVKLVGYCAVDSEKGIQRLLVYEFIPNKSLEDHLFNRALPLLPWNTRLQILLGAAQGLVYLHEDVEVPVIYRDFKSSNVLLDNNFKPKLSDFGLAREGPTGEHTHVSTAVVGTQGYAAPDYIETGHLTTKSDVYSFGVVLYEVLTGRRPFETNVAKTEQKLLDLVKQFPPESKRFSTIIDLRLQNQYSLIAARRIAKLAESCIRKNRDQRPNMREVVECIKLAIQDTDLASPAIKTSKSMGIYPVKANGTESEKSPRPKIARLRAGSMPVG